MRGKYLSKQRLQELTHLLSERDRSILSTLEDWRYLLTGQIGRLHFTNCKNESAALRTANRTMTRLRDHGVVDALERRIGGVRAGSGSYVWSLTESGVNFLHSEDENFAKRKRLIEPSLNFLQHTLGTSETYVQLTEICRSHSLELVQIQSEPACWRGYTSERGKPATMKPDLFAVTMNGDFLDSWFIEIDMNTESPAVILDKCCRYVRYYKSGIEQKEHGVFPLVVWIACSENRKNKLKQYINESRDIPEQYKGIFTVIMPGEFEVLICNGAEGLKC